LAGGKKKICVGKVIRIFIKRAMLEHCFICICLQIEKEALINLFIKTLMGGMLLFSFRNSFRLVGKFMMKMLFFCAVVSTTIIHVAVSHLISLFF
jgi:hypothetical protein